MNAENARSGYFSDPQVERLVDLVLQLSSELNAANQRQHALELLLVQHGLLEAGAVDGFAPDEEQQHQLDSVRDGFLERWFRVMTESGGHGTPLRPEWFAALDAPMP